MDDQSKMEGSAAATNTKIVAQGQTAPDVDEAPPDTSLQSNDVVEIHAFLERRTGIESKVQQFEAMPAIDVFSGADILPTSSARITSLPSRQQLDAWTQELDQIESEMEQFELGDMVRLKELAKSKSEKKMSPEDTDLIDVTLTTLLAVDKLFHLLRARSETLDMLNLRLQWEDQRVLAWETMERLLEELNDFVRRSEWTTSLYDTFSPDLATNASSSQSFPWESRFPRVLAQSARNERRKLGEALLHQAKLIMSRVHNYKHELLPKSGATLDKMIDASSKKVPDTLLDEQDKLENKSMVFEGIDKFIPSLQAQWKKADEFYAELKKDQATAQLLLEELEQVSKLHPSPELAASFLSRSSSLASRLSAIGHPSTIIPRPLHHLAPDRVQKNDAIHLTLSEELASTIKLSRRVELKAKQFNVRAHAVERVATMFSDASRLGTKLRALNDRLSNGLAASGNDGLPPRLDDLGCLDMTAHSSYIALLPSLLQDLSATESDTKNLVKKLTGAVAELRQFNASNDFLQRCKNESDNLTELLLQGMTARDLATKNVDALFAARAIHSSASELQTSVSHFISGLLEAIDAQHWTPRQSTPDPPINPAPILVRVEDAEARASQLLSEVGFRLSSPLDELASTVPEILHRRLQGEISTVFEDAEFSRSLIVALKAVHAQKAEMEGVCKEAEDLKTRIGDLRKSIQADIQDVLQNATSDAGGPSNPFSDMVSDLVIKVNPLIASLPTRVPFVASKASQAPPGDQKAQNGQPQPRRVSYLSATVHRKLAAIDQVVRADVNSMALTLSSGLDSLMRQLDLYHLAGLAKVLDAQLEKFSQATMAALEALEARKREHEALVRGSESSDSTPSAEYEEDFERAIKALDDLLDQHGPNITSLMESSRNTLRQVRSSPGAHDPGVHEEILNPRMRVFEDTEFRAQGFSGDVAASRSYLTEARRQAERRAYQARLTAEHEEMLRRGSLSQAELTTAQNALKESEAKAQAAMDEYRRRWEEEQAKRKEAASQNEAESSAAVQLEPLGMQIAAIRAELRSIGIAAAARLPSSPNVNEEARPSHRLPSFADAQAMRGRFNAVSFAFSDLPSTLAQSHLASEMAALKDEIDRNHELLARVEHLGLFSRLVDQCDAALSDLLEHIDSYPYPPTEVQSIHVSDPQKPPHEQIDERVLFCQKAVLRLHEHGELIADDERVMDETSRIEQTWVELAEMCKDVSRNPPKSGLSSRSTTSLSSVASTSPFSIGPSKAASLFNGTVTRSRNSSSSSKPTKGTPQRRLPSSRPSGTHSRTLSRSSTRSVSGPSSSTPSFSTSVISSTFSSRQRTMSNATAVHVPPTPSTPRARKSSTSHKRAVASPTPSMVSASSIPVLQHSATRPSRPSVGRTGAVALTHRSASSMSDRLKPRRSYVADPKNKLDVAVGSVVNKLPAQVHIEAVTDTWQDESGKYWIGDMEPKLCFCRILRSQMVMVRVGGGWVELSKFIRDHFSHMFRVESVSPTSMRRQTEEKWVSSATLLENMKEEEKTPPKDRPSTPSRLPVLLTPSSRSPPGRSNPSPNTSPLAPLQYIRKVGVEPYVNSNAPLSAPKFTTVNSPATPAIKLKSKSPSPSPLSHFMSPTPSRPPRWR